MIPEEIQTCKPVYRELTKRSEEEIKQIEKLQNKRRKSKSVDGGSKKKKTKRG